jgi:hypothetical protein
VICVTNVICKTRVLLVVACLLCFVPGGLLSQEHPSPEPSLTVVVPVLKGGEAPFSGLLVPEERFRQLLISESVSEAFQEKLEVERKAYDDLERAYLTALDLASRPKPWHQSPEINRWLGFGAGVLVAALVTFGVVEVYKVAK